MLRNWPHYYGPDETTLTGRRICLRCSRSEGLTAWCDTPSDKLSIKVFQHDWMPGFAAFHDDGIINETAEAHVVLNLGSLLAAIKEGDLEAKDLPYMVAESLMHEVIHVLEAWANEEFSEDRVEALLTKYREMYQRGTVWEYTGAEPATNHEQTDVR